jgi:hypothetical protein
LRAILNKARGVGAGDKRTKEREKTQNKLMVFGFKLYHNITAFIFAFMSQILLFP